MEFYDAVEYPLTFWKKETKATISNSTNQPSNKTAAATEHKSVFHGLLHIYHAVETQRLQFTPALQEAPPSVSGGHVREDGESY